MSIQETLNNLSIESRNKKDFETRNKKALKEISNKFEKKLKSLMLGSLSELKELKKSDAIEFDKKIKGTQAEILNTLNDREQSILNDFIKRFEEQDSKFKDIPDYQKLYTDLSKFVKKEISNIELPKIEVKTERIIEKKLEPHKIVQHTDTKATGAELNRLTQNYKGDYVDDLHTHDPEPILKKLNPIIDQAVNAIAAKEISLNLGIGEVGGQIYNSIHTIRLKDSRVIYKGGGIVEVDTTYNPEVDILKFNTLYSKTGTEPAGSIYWNTVDGTLDMRMYNNTTLQVGQEMYFYGKASGNITNGELCEFAGVQGDHILVKKAVAAEIIANPHYCVGVATQNITNGNYGYITWFGKVNNVYTKTPANGDTADWVAGDILYFNNSTGQLTKTAPTAPNINIIVAAVIKEQTGSSENGIIIVRPTFGKSLSELNDVDGSAPDTTGDLLSWNNTSSVWERNSYNITDYLTKASGKIGDQTTNYTEFDTTGHQTMVGSAKPWEDLRIEPSVRGTGVNNPAFEKYYDDAGGTSRGVYLYSFTDEVTNNQKEVFFTMQMPHEWDGGPISMHVHWVGNSDDTNATPIWGLEYVWKDIGQVFGDTTIVYTTGGNFDGSGSADPNVTAGKHYLSEFADLIPGISADGLSSILIGRLFRFSGDASDTYDVAGNKCGLLYIDAHYQKNSLGSTDEYVK